MADIGAERIEPSARGNWLNQVENEWDDLLPAADKKTKAAKVKGQERAVFKLFSNGTVTARDEWITARSENEAASLIREFSSRYEAEARRLNEDRKARKPIGSLSNYVSRTLKWTAELERHLDKGSLKSAALSKLGPYR